MWNEHAGTDDPCAAKESTPIDGTKDRAAGSLADIPHEAPPRSDRVHHTAT